MADIPEFKAKTAIKEGGGMPSFSHAMGNKPITPPKEPMNQKNINDFNYYTQYASQASHELAESLGRFRGQSPGGLMIPPIFENQKTFHEAYKKEELMNLELEGKKTLAEQQNIARRKLDPTSLGTYQKEGTQTIHDILNTATPENRPILKRALKAQYENGVMDLSEAIYKKQQEEALSVFKVNMDNTVDSIYNNTYKGNEALSKDDIKSAHDQINLAAGKYGITREFQKSMHDAVDNAKTKGEYDKKVEEWIDEGIYLQKIREFQTNRPEGMEPTKHQEILRGMMQHAKQVQAAISGDQYMIYSQTKNDIDSGVKLSPTEIATRKARMGEEYAVKLDHDLIAGISQNTRIQGEAQSIIENANNAVFLANSTPAPINHAVDKIIIPAAEAIKGEPLTLTEQSQLLSTFKAPVESFQKRLSAGLTNGNAQQRLDAASALSLAKEVNPILVKGMTKNELSLADIYKRKMNDPKYQTPDGPDKIRDELYKIDDDTLKERTRQVQTYIKDNQLNDAIILKSATVKALGLKPSKELKLPAGLTNVYMNMIRDGIMRTGDTIQAKQDADFEIKQYYGEDDKGKVKFMPPEKAYTNLGYILQNDKLRAVKEMVDNNKQIKEKGGFVLNDISWVKEPDFNDILKKPLHNGPIELMIDGKLREIEFDSDVTTQFSDSNNISWGLGYINDYGQVNPLINPFSKVGTYRFIPNRDMYMEAQNSVDIQQNINKYNMEKLNEEEQIQLKRALSIRAEKQFKEEEKAQLIQEFLDVGSIQ